CKTVESAPPATATGAGCDSASARSYNWSNDKRLGMGSPTSSRARAAVTGSHSGCQPGYTGAVLWTQLDRSARAICISEQQPRQGQTRNNQHEYSHDQPEQYKPLIGRQQCLFS